MKAHFDWQPVAERLLEESYRLLAGLPLFLLALMVVAISWWLGSWVSRRKFLQRVARDNPFLLDLVRTTVRWALTLIGILVALEIMDATALVGALLGTAGVLGVALGFAFKETLENYLAGILMSLRQPFAPRDHVVIDGNEGVVMALTSRATILMTPDGNHLRLPNALVFRSVTLNYTRNPNRRFTVDVGIGVNEDLVRAQRIGLDVLETLSGVIKSPPPRAYIAALGDSNVQVRFHGWVDQRGNDFLMVRSEAIRQLKLALEAADMDMPEPIYRVQLTEARPHLATAKVEPSRDRRAIPATEVVDTSQQSDISQQIDQESNRPGATDLLDRNAPQE